MCFGVVVFSFMLDPLQSTCRLSTVRLINGVHVQNYIYTEKCDIKAEVVFELCYVRPV